MKQLVGIIPARYASTRFPGKMLAPLLGKSLLQRTYEQACKSQKLKTILIATDDERIAKHVRSFGAEVVMTSANHETGSDRLVEVVSKHPMCRDAAIIVNVQGDEPLLDPNCIDQVIERLEKDPAAVMATVAHPLYDEEAWHDPSVVKCVIDSRGRALYFSRAPIPHSADGVPEGALHHVGIYAFRRDFLLRYGQLESTPLQQRESLEQLRVLEHGEAIQVAVLPGQAFGVDTPADLERAEQVLCKQNISSSPAVSSPR